MVKKSHTKLRVRCGAAEAELRTSPAQLEVSVGGTPALVWNAGKQFIFEHLREQQEGDPEGWWAENFKTHHDSKPKGPAAISFDVHFPGTRHLYGLPERASSLALQPTRGPEGPLSGATPRMPRRRPSAACCPAPFWAMVGAVRHPQSAGDASPLVRCLPCSVLVPVPPVLPARTAEPYRLYNLDVFEYLHDSPFGLYGAIPLMLAHRPEQTVGVFWCVCPCGRCWRSHRGRRCLIGRWNAWARSAANQQAHFVPCWLPPCPPRNPSPPHPSPWLPAG